MTRAIEQAAPSAGRPAALPTTKTSWRGGQGAGAGANFEPASSQRDKGDRIEWRTKGDG